MMKVRELKNYGKVQTINYLDKSFKDLEKDGDIYNPSKARLITIDCEYCGLSMVHIRPVKTHHIMEDNQFLYCRDCEKVLNHP